jgi:hypothetical protein
MLQENTIRYKQILIDIDNYNLLKDLGKAGDSFNDVIHDLLNRAVNISPNSSNEITENRLIEMGPGENSFILKIDSGLRKVGVNRISCFKDCLEIDFLDENGVTVNYPNDLQRIPGAVESSLLNSDFRLANYVVKRIVEYFQEHVYTLEVCIKELA